LTKPHCVELPVVRVVRVAHACVFCAEGANRLKNYLARLQVNPPPATLAGGFLFFSLLRTNGHALKRPQVAGQEVGNTGRARAEQLPASANTGCLRLLKLESESIYILREAVAEFAHPVMMYSIGKDSSVMLRLAQKAFYPGKIPFPLLHIDTSFKFPEMIVFRDSYAKEIGAQLIVHRNEEALQASANPFTLERRNAAACSKPRVCWTPRQKEDLTRLSVELDATKRNRAPRRGFTRFGTLTVSGIPRISGRN
jgi:hypothetical protein